MSVPEGGHLLGKAHNVGLSVARRGLLKSARAGLRWASRSGTRSLAHAYWWGISLAQVGWNRILGRRPLHLLVTGLGESDVADVHERIRAWVGAPAFVPGAETPALETIRVWKRWIVTRDTDDLFRVQEIVKDLGRFRDIIVLVIIRDPRDCVSCADEQFDGQAPIGYDYRLVRSHSAVSYTGRGIAAMHEAVKTMEAYGVRMLMVRYEDLDGEVAGLRNRLAFGTGMFQPEGVSEPVGFFHDAPPQDGSTDGTESQQTARPAWTSQDRFLRVQRQVNLFPDLEKIATRWGYPALSEVAASHSLLGTEPHHRVGTIVAFHTDDEVYREEARRFAARLRELGLAYDLTVVPPRSEWVANCAMKPEFLLEVRKRLRGPLLYLDVDAYVHRDPWPYLSQYDGDMAVYVHGAGHLVSATILIDDTPGALLILKRWVDEQKGKPHVYDQKVLQDVIERAEDGEDGMPFRVQRLPPNLNYICDRPNELLCGDVIIEQLQVSRVVKRGKRGEAMEARITALRQGSRATE